VLADRQEGQRVEDAEIGASAKYAGDTSSRASPDAGERRRIANGIDREHRSDNHKQRDE